MLRLAAGLVLAVVSSPVFAQSFDYGVANAQATQQTYLSSVTSSNIIRGMYDGGANVGRSGIYVGRPGSQAGRDIDSYTGANRYAGTSRYPGGGATFARPAPVSAASIAMPFRSTPASRRAAQDGLVSRVIRATPEAGRLVAEQMRQYDFSRIYTAIVAPFGYRANDTADAVAAYTLLGWLIATGAPDPSRGAARAVRNQVAEALAENPRFADARSRTELAEEMKLLFVTLHAGWQSARKEGSLRAYGDGVAGMFRQFTGNDLRAMRLTERGFVRG